MVNKPMQKFSTADRTPLILLCCCWVCMQALQSLNAAELALDTELAKRSYSLGVNVGHSLLKQDPNLDLSVLFQAITDAYQQQSLQLSDEDRNKTLNTLYAKLRAKRAAQEKVIATQNRAKGDAFLAKNRLNKKVVETRSGLQYQVINPGQGRRPVGDNKVQLHVIASLVDGTEFKNTRKDGKPNYHLMNHIPTGWREALQKMPVGARWKIVLPPELAYGDERYGPHIGPGSTLVYDIELLRIEKYKYNY